MLDFIQNSSFLLGGGEGRGKRRRKEKKESANSEKRVEVMEVRAARWWSF